jgi:RND family efflux transporter MFP subunit
MKFASQWVALAGVLCAVLVASCSKTPAPGHNKPGGKARPVKLAHVEARSMERTIPVTGSLAPKERSTLSAKVAGRVEQLLVDIGSQVRKGDLIAQIETRDYQLRVQQAAAALAQARAALGLPLEGDSDGLESQAVSSVKQAKAVLEEAAKNLERVRSLSQSRIASAFELDTVEAAHKVALTRYEAAVEDARARLAALAQRRADLEIARKQLTDASVLAPFDGAIQSRPASIGEFVSVGAPIATLVRTDPLRLRLEVPERECQMVRSGQAVRLAVEGDTNVYTGQITRLSPALEETDRMLLVEADVPNAGSLRAGLYARAEIVVDERQQGLSVPGNALLTFAGIEKVLTIHEGKVVEKPVTTGRRHSDWVEILSGAAAGTPVILDPVGLRGGQPVAPSVGVERVQAASAASVTGSPR